MYYAICIAYISFTPERVFFRVFFSPRGKKECKNPMANANKTHKLIVAAMLSAVATVLMFLDFSIPMLVPSFIKLDISELPALLASFSLGPGYGIAVCLVKNIINLSRTSTAGIGELCNFMVGVNDSTHACFSSYDCIVRHCVIGCNVVIRKQPRLSHILRITKMIAGVLFWRGCPLVSICFDITVFATRPGDWDIAKGRYWRSCRSSAIPLLVGLANIEGFPLKSVGGRESGSLSPALSLRPVCHGQEI